MTPDWQLPRARETRAGFVDVPAGIHTDRP